MANAQAPALAQAGRRLLDEAKEHMRSSRYHRRRAKELYAQIEDLKAECRTLGIAIVLDETITQPGRPSDRRSTP